MDAESSNAEGSSGIPTAKPIFFLQAIESIEQREEVSTCLRYNSATLAMVGPRVTRPASRFLSSILPSAAPRTSLDYSRPAFAPRISVPAVSARRRYATPSGIKEVAVRDALNEALAEELESNNKVFVLGEEVAQYNGAYVTFGGTPDRTRPTNGSCLRDRARSACLLAADMVIEQIQGYQRSPGPLRREKGHR